MTSSFVVTSALFLEVVIFTNFHDFDLRMDNFSTLAHKIAISTLLEIKTTPFSQEICKTEIYKKL